MRKIIAIVLAAVFVLTSTGSVFASDTENEYVPKEWSAEYSEREFPEEAYEILVEDYNEPIEEQPAEETGYNDDTVNEIGTDIDAIEINSSQEELTDEPETSISSYEAIEQASDETTPDIINDPDDIFIITDVQVTVRKPICQGTHCTTDGTTYKYTDYNYIDATTELYNLEYTVSYTKNNEDLIFTGSSEDIFHMFGEYPSLTYLGTVKSTGKLTVCESLVGVEYSFVVSIVNHDVVIDPAVEATCINTGLTEGTHCSICGTVVMEQEEIPMSEHTIVTDEAVAPTMTDTGLTEGSHCSVCNTVITEQKVLPALSDNGWHYIEDNWYYYKDGTVVTGWQYIDNYWYYLGADGKMWYGGWKNIDNDRYYLGAGGKVQTGWHYIDGYWYYMGAGGRMWYDGWKYIDNDWYYLSADGKVQTGWHYIDGYWYYMGAGGRMWYGGWKYIDNDWYYLGTGGKVQTGWHYIDGYWYYMGAGGRMWYGGWKYIDNDWYYLGTGGKVQTGWHYINGYWYYMGAGGRMWYGGWKHIDNDWYYLGTGGKVQTGWNYINNYWYYMGAGGRMKTGWQYINDKWYYFYDWGGMLSGTGIVQIDDDYWYFKNDTLNYITDLATVDGVTYAVTKGKASSDKVDVAEMYASKKLDEIGWNLKAAYNWAVDITYEHDAYAYTTSGAAIHSFSSEIGDCIGKAAVFYWMARLLGYDVKLILGSVPLRAGGYGEHGWVEIVYNGSTYVCDPTFEWQTGYNGYMIYYGQSNTWRYVIGDAMADK